MVTYGKKLVEVGVIAIIFAIIIVNSYFTVLEGDARESRSLASKLDSYVLSASLSSRQATTDSNGRAVFSNLPLGLYFVKQINSVRGYADCRSFIVTVPYKTGITYNYEINASPKTDTEKLVDITIKKVWNTDESTPITDSVTIQLLRNGNLVATAILSEQNSWQMRFLDMPQSDAYSVLEAEVPQGFTATYTQNGLEFTVTNTSALIDAGQLVWPIPILAMAGMLLIAVGYVLLRKSSNQNG